MELYQQSEDITVIGIHVITFPDGIKEAFESLMKVFGSERDYYGISWMDENNNVIYYAMAGEIFQDEGKQYDYESLTVTKGVYKTETLHNWLSKTDCIKNIFHDLMGEGKPDQNNPCIEWYKSDEEMLCMIKA
jgi:hypothetical protein